MYKDTLIKIGLNEGEAKIYETLLLEGALPVILLSKKINLTRTNTYNILSSLIKKGLVESVEKKKKMYFHAGSPEKLRNIFEKTNKEKDIIKDELTNILPALTSAFLASSNKPSINYWEGISGLERIYNDILKEKKNLLIFASIIDREMPEFNKLIDKQIKKQIKQEIKVKALVREETLTNNYAQNKKAKNIEVRGLKNYKPTSQIIIYGDKVAITSFKKDLMSTLIQNESIANSLKNIFEIIWQNVKPNIV